MTNGGGPIPESLIGPARARLSAPAQEGRGDRGRFGRGGGPGGGFGGGPGAGAGGAVGFRGDRPVPVVIAGQVAGVVVVPPRAPFSFLVRRYAPTLTLVSSGALIVGALLAAVVIFGPARKRLLAVEDAARRLGRGDLTARAPAEGGDEVAAVAMAFNSMAHDLGARAEALATSDRMRRQLLADVSHELTTPVTAMRGYLETLAMPEFAVDEATRTRYLGIIDDETQRLERIIGDLLDLARLEGGGGTLSIGDVRVAHLFDRVSARHERAGREAGVSIVARIESGADIVVGDRDRLEQAMQNLAANALRYAPPGTSIELRARREGAWTVLSVADEGPGIPAEHLPRVFDRFYKAEASRMQQAGVGGGSGLGLSIVRAIVERHGGTAAVRSRPGQTVFDLRLPPSDVHPAESDV
jgi:two-component system sensor histidine kinase BaeS